MTESPTSAGLSPARSEDIEVARGAVALAGTLEAPAVAAGEHVPLVILMHGFTGSQDEPVIRATAQSLLDAGIASIRFDFDAHGDSTGEMVNMTVPAEIEDARAVYDFVRTLPFVSDVGLLGHSQGGVVAAMLAGQLQDKASALVLLAPATSIRDSAREGDILGARFDPDDPPPSITVFGFELGRDYILTAQTLPVREVPARFTGPVSLVQGEADALLPVSLAMDYAGIFADSQLRLLPEQDHDFYHDPDQPAAIAADFFSQHLH